MEPADTAQICVLPVHQLKGQSSTVWSNGLVWSHTTAHKMAANGVNSVLLAAIMAAPEPVFPTRANKPAGQGGGGTGECLRGEGWNNGQKWADSNSNLHQCPIIFFPVVSLPYLPWTCASKGWIIEGLMNAPYQVETSMTAPSEGCSTLLNSVAALVRRIY